MTRYGISLGAFTVSTFALIVLVAVTAGAALSAHLARRRGLPLSAVRSAAMWGLAAAILFGRLFFILTPPPSVAVYYDRQWYFSHFLDLQAGPLALWVGGLDPAGMLVGAALAAFLAARQNRLPVRAWADVLTPGALLALALAPWANIANEQMLGPPTSLPWGIAVARRITPYDDLTLYPAGLRFHPTPAYVSLWALAVLVVVLCCARRRSAAWPPGRLFLLGSAMMLPALFAADFLRSDVAQVIPGLSMMQITALLGLAATLIAGVRKRELAQDG